MFCVSRSFLLINQIKDCFLRVNLQFEMVDFQFFQSCLSTSYYCGGEKKRTNFYIVLNVKKLSLFAESALCRKYSRQIIDLISCTCCCSGAVCSTASRGGAPAGQGCIAALCRCSCACALCDPFLRASAFPAPSEPLEGAVACKHGSVSRVTGVGAHIHCAVPAGKAASPG